VITAVDTNILLDLLIPDGEVGEQSEHQLQAAAEGGAVVITPIVAAELAAFFSNEADFEAFLNETGIRLDELQLGSLHAAGQAWSAYSRRRGALTCAQCGTEQAPKCGNCGATLRARQHIISDFLIGGHALIQADQLLTRDRGYYKTYFPKLKLVPVPK
jgi:predicted nucleic acid-binding protein